MPQNNHGALGSNQPLERVPVEEPPVAEKEKEVIAEEPVATSSATNKDDGDMVYLRDDLRPVR